MTTPGFDVSTIVPTKYKPLVGLIGSALTFIVPTVLDASTALPDPWPWVIAAVVAGLTWLGIYKAPYKPAGTVLVPEATVRTDSVPRPNMNINVGPGLGADIMGIQQGEYRNVWKNLP